MSTEALKRTPLFELHQQLGGKIVPFAGWELPVQYSGVIPEHHAVRTKAGLFDVSHMGEIFVSGPDAEKALDALTCNAVRTLVDGKAHYSALLNDRGGVVDDIIIYRFSAERFLVCVNASNADKDFEWMSAHNKWNASFENKSAEFGQIALQGPRAETIVRKLKGAAKTPALQYFHFCEESLEGIPVIAARTGYTGEDGFEFFVPWKRTAELWNHLLRVGQSEGLVPAGLGARDSLRLEACYPLHGHELGDDISALESGLGWVVKFDKGEFVGKAALQAEKQRGLARTLVGFVVDDAGIARHQDPVVDSSGKVIGVVTSGTKTPTLNKALGMALIASSAKEPGTKVAIEVRGRKLAATVVKKPFYTKPKNP